MDNRLKQNLAQAVSMETVHVRMNPYASPHGGNSRVEYPDAYRIVERIEQALERLGYRIEKIERP